MKLKLIAGALFALSATSAHADVIITGILDGTFSGGDPKVIELYVSGEEDLSTYKMQRSANGGSFTTNISLSGDYENEFVYLGSVDLCCTYFTQQYMGSHIIENASDTMLA